MRYWVNINGVQHGPMDLEELKRLDITSSAYVWHEGLADWTQVQNLPDLWEQIKPAEETAVPITEPIVEQNDEPVAEQTVQQEPASPAAETSSDDSTGANDDDPQQHIVVETTVTVSPADTAIPAIPTNTSCPPPCPPPVQYGYGIPMMPAQQPFRQETPKCPPTNLVWAILSVILCCQVTGAVAIIYAAQVSSKFNNGEYETAQKYSDRAAMWSIASICIGVMWLPFSVILALL